MPNNTNFNDVLLKQVHVLPTSAAAASSSGIDLMNSSTGDFLAEGDLSIDAPALSTTELPDTKTMTYTIEHDTDPAFGTTTTLATIGTQTGAGGVGAAAAQYRYRPPETVKRYVRATATLVAAAGNPSAKSFTFRWKS
jgi:hypothetical protein